MGAFKEMLMENDEIIPPYEDGGEDLPLMAYAAHTAAHGVRVENVPDELKAGAVWLLWAKVPNDKAHSGFDKVPVNARTLGAGSSTNAGAWCDLDTAVQSLEAHYGEQWQDSKGRTGNICGLGFALNGLDDIFVIDVDNIDDLDSDFEGADMVRALGSYTERSVSGHGLHIICKGQKPAGICKKGRFEVYDSGRYMTFTGEICYGFNSIRDCTDNFKPYYEKYFVGDEKDKNVRKSEKVSTPTPATAAPPSASGMLTDNEIIEKCMNERNGSGDKFRRLWHGEYDGDQSAADLALCNKLAFYTTDTAQIDRLFRQSGLYRDKWDEVHYTSGETYGQHTIECAVNDCRTNYVSAAHYGGGNAVAGRLSITAVKRNSEGVSVPAGEVAGEVLENYGTMDSGNCERFVHAVGDKVLYNKTREAWAFFAGNCWKYGKRGGEIQFYKDTVQNLVDRELERAVVSVADEDEKAVKKLCKAYAAIFNTLPIKHALEQAKSKLGRCDSDFDCEDNFEKLGISCEINTPAGIIMYGGAKHNYKMGVIPHEFELNGVKKTMITAKWLLTKCTAAGEFGGDILKVLDRVYSGEINCPTWEKCIDDWTGGDKELAHFLQKAAGYSITTLTREKCYFYLYGAGDNGKSVFCGVLKDIIGDYCTTINAAALSPTRGGGTINNDELADLNGARMVFVHEQGNKRLDSETIKRISGDGDTVKATRKYERPIEFVPVCKLWITSNEPFTTNDTSKGAWTRPVIINFAEIPKGKRDRGLKDKLKEEYDDILLWLLKGVEMYLNEGLEHPDSVKQAVEAARADCDIVGQFLSECTESAEGAVIPSKLLYQAWKLWTEERGEYAGSNTYFGRKLAEHGLIKKRMSKGNYYIGIDLHGE